MMKPPKPSTTAWYAHMAKAIRTERLALIDEHAAAGCEDCKAHKVRQVNGAMSLAVAIAEFAATMARAVRQAKEASDAFAPFERGGVMAQGAGSALAESAKGAAREWSPPAKHMPSRQEAEAQYLRTAIRASEHRVGQALIDHYNSIVHGSDEQVVLTRARLSGRRKAQLEFHNAVTAYPSLAASLFPEKPGTVYISDPGDEQPSAINFRILGKHASSYNLNTFSITQPK